MKNLSFYFLIGLLFATSVCFAQTYTVIAKDSSGDASGDIDIKSLAYRIDATKDSIWFKLETYNAVSTSSDFGLMIGLDTDKVTTNGNVWPGSNASMKYDKALIVMMDNIMPGFYYAEMGVPATTSTVTVHVQRPDDYTFIINTKLSLVDHDGKFNLLAGTTEFDAAYVTNPTIYDEVPDAGKGFLTIPATSSGVQNMSMAVTDLITYPNPCMTKFTISGSTSSLNPVNIELYSCDGRIVYSDTIVSEGLHMNYSVATNAMQGGIYFLKMKQYGSNDVYAKIRVLK